MGDLNFWYSHAIHTLRPAKTVSGRGRLEGKKGLFYDPCRIAHNEHRTRHPLRICPGFFVILIGEVSNFLVGDLKLLD
jgi:hypothetical protein